MHALLLMLSGVLTEASDSILQLVQKLKSQFQSEIAAKLIQTCQQASISFATTFTGVMLQKLVNIARINYCQQPIACL